MFSVDTEEEAKQLLVIACMRGLDGHYYARELVDEQTLANLRRFSNKCQLAWDHMQRAKERRNK